ncbi:hypothetical protein HPB52_009776 [Rhipicephalus sanguineus]|uniref:Uncharacterized protein n=1 Tax=Rhipicephalus sanguineus TaxID=34632 RepID=A0A9D4SNB5_RHISA|nr:hypothetical protein HPB52_009776 [Rhipicephalus sanguineus]
MASWSAKAADANHIRRLRANEIKKTLSKTVRPCDDFYKYVCSEWEKANEIPSDRVTHGAFNEVEEKLLKDLREILGEIPVHSGWGQSATQKLAIAYNACVANENPDRRSLDELKALLAESGFEKWPLVSKNKKNLGDYNAVLLKTGMAPLFSMGVTRDTKHLSRNIIVLPLLDLLNLEFKLVNITLTENEPVAIMAERYFALATKFLKTVSARALFNYMGWRAVLMRASHASKRFRAANLDFSKASTGLMKEPPLWETCAKLLSSAMKEVVGRLYVKKKFTAHAKEDVDDFRHREPFVRMLEMITENDYKNDLLDLRQPFNKTLNSMNLGAIGTVIGHEMTHGYDDTGSQYDGDGRLQQWWSKRTRQLFMDKANCFVKQYGDIFDAEAGMQLTLGS